MPEIRKNKRVKIIKFLEQVLNKNISNIIFAGMEHLERITEYDFSVFKVILIDENGHKEEVYIRIIKAGKIKESIFCYWSLLYEDYLKSNKFGTDNIPIKISITQQAANQNDSNISLKIDSNIDYCAEINLIELEKFAVENKLLERWGDDFKIKSEDILFIGRKMY